MKLNNAQFKLIKKNLTTENRRRKNPAGSHQSEMMIVSPTTMPRIVMYLHHARSMSSTKAPRGITQAQEARPRLQRRPTPQHLPQSHRKRPLPSHHGRNPQSEGLLCARQLLDRPRRAHTLYSCPSQPVPLLPSLHIMLVFNSHFSF